MNDKDFYLLLTKMYEEVKKQVADRGIEKVPRIMIWGWMTDIDISLSSMSGSPETQVEGKELSVLVDEYCRRLGFNQAQKTLALAPPIVENEVPSEDPVISLNEEA
jgi:hypothetical protein